jgi:hypothetical protein
MNGTWTERADKILELFKKLPIAVEGSPEKEFYKAVWSLCQELKYEESRMDGGQMIVPNF